MDDISRTRLEHPKYRPFFSDIVSNQYRIEKKIEANIVYFSLLTSFLKKISIFSRIDTIFLDVVSSRSRIVVVMLLFSHIVLVSEFLLLLFSHIGLVSLLSCCCFLVSVSYRCCSSR